MEETVAGGSSADSAGGSCTSALWAAYRGYRQGSLRGNIDIDVEVDVDIVFWAAQEIRLKLWSIWGRM